MCECVNVPYSKGWRVRNQVSAATTLISEIELEITQTTTMISIFQKSYFGQVAPARAEEEALPISQFLVKYTNTKLKQRRRRAMHSTATRRFNWQNNYGPSDWWLLLDPVVQAPVQA